MVYNNIKSFKKRSAFDFTYDPIYAVPDYKSIGSPRITTDNFHSMYISSQFGNKPTTVIIKTKENHIIKPTTQPTYNLESNWRTTWNGPTRSHTKLRTIKSKKGDKKRCDSSIVVCILKKLRFCKQ
ncbi:hypothetical protein K7432_005962 [Basidiobolus ranarum]|uniref:Uncharacterized protein n=1 Tax=Basidiobolus ranarum TaxID=34480 RepID=A0ABR2W2G1_9FUNG